MGYKVSLEKYTEAFRFFDFGYFVSTEVISFPLFPVRDCPVFYTNLSETSRVSGMFSRVLMVILVGGFLFSGFILGLLLSLCIVCSVIKVPLQFYGVAM